MSPPVLPTPRDGTGQEVVEEITDAVVAFRDDVAGASGVRGFGISVPNFVDGPQWVQRWANNLPLSRESRCDQLSLLAWETRSPWPMT